MLRDEDSVDWASNQLRKNYAPRFDCKVISVPQIIQLSKIANISTMVVPHEAVFTDNMQRLMRYVLQFEENYGVRRIHIFVMVTADDMKYSN